MRVFKTRFMARFCRSEGISDQMLADAVARAERGLVDADLGGGLIKQRVARPGKGRSGGWRTLIAYRRENRAVFVFGFSKSDRDNIGQAQAADLRSAADDVLSLASGEIAAKLADGSLQEVAYEEEN